VRSPTRSERHSNPWEIQAARWLGQRGAGAERTYCRVKTSTRDWPTRTTGSGFGGVLEDDCGPWNPPRCSLEKAVRNANAPLGGVLLEHDTAGAVGRREQRRTRRTPPAHGAWPSPCPKPTRSVLLAPHGDYHRQDSRKRPDAKHGRAGALPNDHPQHRAPCEESDRHPRTALGVEVERIGLPHASSALPAHPPGHGESVAGAASGPNRERISAPASIVQRSNTSWRND
jgi:hypothetical protein